jgi:hypothetical protein
VDGIDQAIAVCPKINTYISLVVVYTLGLPYADKLDITKYTTLLRQILSDIDSKIWELSDSVFNSKTIIMYDFTFQTFLRK